VVSSGAINPARAPASIDMLETVSRPSIDMSRITDPVYSMTWPVPPAAPMRPMTARIMSFGLTPKPEVPSMRTSIAFDFWRSRVWVASTCSTSDVPIPKASAPSAPCEAVWLSPHTTVVPGRVKPCSGPTTWTMPCSGALASM
jgi:hypothetical protein